MKTITTNIIPLKPAYAKVKAPHELHLEAICIFVAIGFFLDTDTYWRDIVVLRPCCNHKLDEAGYLISSTPYFEWYYKPNTELRFDEVLTQFTSLFENIVAEQTLGKNVILPLSGGLDSRSQAVALNHLNANVKAYSYEFEGGYPETEIAEKIANICNFKFNKFKIPKGYLWSVIDDLSKINRCESDFTAPRQMAVVNEFEKMGDVFSLGHWGDVLFDDMGVADDLTLEKQATVVQKKLLKKGGLLLATKLWNHWQLDGDFGTYFNSRVYSLLEEINITDSANARIRAFKSLYWAPRWTSINLEIFANKYQITLPYYDHRMCEFICTVPEEFLAKRQLQIAYIKKRAPKIAKITWQDQKPFNLFTFNYNKLPYNLPYRIGNKLKRVLNESFGKKYVQRNWELQFLGTENSRQLESYLRKPTLSSWVSETLITEILDGFQSNETQLQYAHPINMLLTLSMKAEINWQ